VIELAPLASWAVCGAGHVIFGGSSVGGGGGVGAVALPQPAANSAAAAVRVLSRRRVPTG
jgi:hypothetical protein